MFTFNINLETGAKLEKLLEGFLNCVCDKPKKATRFIFRRVVIDGIAVEGDIKKMAVGFNKQIPVEAMAVDADGNKANIQAGTAKWSSSDETVATVTVDPTNELKARVLTNNAGIEGSAVITLEADGDRSPTGVAQIVGTGTVDVYGPNATVFNLNFGEPVEPSEN